MEKLNGTSGLKNLHHLRMRIYACSRLQVVEGLAKLEFFYCVGHLQASFTGNIA